MKYVGWGVLIVGLIWVIVALNMDVSVVTQYGGRVNNIGLMASRQNHIIIGGFIALCGVLMAIFGRSNAQTSSMVKCPMCAELIQPEAVKCKHCGSDVKPQRPAVQANEPFTGELVKTGQNGAELDNDAVLALAARYSARHPNLTVGEIMMTNLPEINRYKTWMSASLGKQFEVALENALKAVRV